METDEFTIKYDANVVVAERMMVPIGELNYRPQIVQSRVEFGSSIRGSDGDVPEPVASAIGAAGELNKFLFVDFFAEWCGACNKMDSTTFNNPTIKAAQQRFVFLKVDTDQHPDSARHFKVVGMPTLIVLGAGGEEVYRQVGPIQADQLLQDLSAFTDRPVE